MIRVRTYLPDDRAFVLGLAPRLAIGMQPWRDLERWLTTVEGWLSESIHQHNRSTVVLIAEDERGERLGGAATRSATDAPAATDPAGAPDVTPIAVDTPPATAFSYEIRSAPPDDYAGFERLFPTPQDWRGYDSLCVWVKGNWLSADLVIQFRELSGEVWAYRTNLAGFDAWDFCLPIDQETFRPADWSTYDNGVVDLHAIDYYGFFVNDLGTGTGTIWVDDVRVR